MQFTQIIPMPDGTTAGTPPPLTKGTPVLPKCPDVPFCMPKIGHTDTIAPIAPPKPMPHPMAEEMDELTPQSVVDTELPFVPVAALANTSRRPDMGPVPQNTATKITTLDLSPQIDKLTGSQKTIVPNEIPERGANIQNVFVAIKSITAPISGGRNANVFRNNTDQIPIEYRRFTDAENPAILPQKQPSNPPANSSVTSVAQNMQVTVNRSQIDTIQPPQVGTDTFLPEAEHKTFFQSPLVADKPASGEPLRGHDTSVMRQIRQVVPDAPVTQKSQYDIELAPKELGQVRMQITPGDQTIAITIQCDLEGTTHLMRRNIDILTRDLMQMGYANINIDIGQNKQNHHSNTQVNHGIDHTDTSDQSTDQTMDMPPHSHNILGPTSRIDIKV